MTPLFCPSVIYIESQTIIGNAAAAMQPLGIIYSDVTNKALVQPCGIELEVRADALDEIVVPLWYTELFAERSDAWFTNFQNWPVYAIQFRPTDAYVQNIVSFQCPSWTCVELRFSGSEAVVEFHRGNEPTITIKVSQAHENLRQPTNERDFAYVIALTAINSPY